MGKLDELNALSKKMRQRILELANFAGKSGSHVGGGLSVTDLLVALYGSVLRFDPNNPEDVSRDRFILSKGHSANALYAILELVGFLKKEDVDLFEVNGSPFYAHASRNLHHGIEFSGGSLSLGLSFGVGVAIACKKSHIDNHIYVLLGDGECDEGLVWESLMSAANFGLNNLTVIVDCNGIQSDGYVLEVMNQFSLADKFTSFGFYTQEIDGHNMPEILSSFENRKSDQPNAIIAKTIKGKGVSFMENNVNWHHGVLSNEQFQTALAEINQIPYDHN